MKARILVIDDEAAIRDSLRMILEYEDYRFLGAANGPEGIAMAQRERPDLVLLDIKMPGMDGMEVLRTLRAADEALPIVMISGHGTTATAVDAIKSGATDFLEKPLGSERVIVPTNSLYIECLVGTHPLLEDFKLIHRALDVKKVQAEVRHAELENIRLAAKALEGDREDPDIEKKVVITGAATNGVVIGTE
jgi:DNA-binding response OmpR family regulator